MLIKLVFIRNIDSDKLLFDDYYKIKILFSIVKSKLTHRKSIENKTILLLIFLYLDHQNESNHSDVFTNPSSLEKEEEILT